MAIPINVEDLLNKRKIESNRIEEAVVNALYHRDYQEREPVEITIGPQKISILSFAGPDRSISLDAIHKAEYLNSRRYRNRRLGDYLKELQLSEGHRRGKNSQAAAGNVDGANGMLKYQRSIPEMFEPNKLCFASDGKVLQLQTVMITVQIS